MGMFRDLIIVTANGGLVVNRDYILNNIIVEIANTTLFKKTLLISSNSNYASMSNISRNVKYYARFVIEYNGVKYPIIGIKSKNKNLASIKATDNTFGVPGIKFLNSSETDISYTMIISPGNTFNDYYYVNNTTGIISFLFSKTSSGTGNRIIPILQFDDLQYSIQTEQILKNTTSGSATMSYIQAKVN